MHLALLGDYSSTACCYHQVALCSQPDELNLLEDGLQLWLIALRNAPSPHGPLLALYSNLTPIMQRSTGTSSALAVSLAGAMSCGMPHACAALHEGCCCSGGLPLRLVLGQWGAASLQCSCLTPRCPVSGAWCSQIAAAPAEHVQLACQITASCTLLGQAEFLQHYGAAAAHILEGLVGEWAISRTAASTCQLHQPVGKRSSAGQCAASQSPLACHLYRLPGRLLSATSPSLLLSSSAG